MYVLRRMDGVNLLVIAATSEESYDKTAVSILDIYISLHSFFIVDISNPALKGGW